MLSLSRKAVAKMEKNGKKGQRWKATYDIISEKPLFVWLCEAFKQAFFIPLNQLQSFFAASVSERLTDGNIKSKGDHPSALSLSSSSESIDRVSFIVDKYTPGDQKKKEFSIMIEESHLEKNLFAERNSLKNFDK